MSGTFSLNNSDNSKGLKTQQENAQFLLSLFASFRSMFWLIVSTSDNLWQGIYHIQPSVPNPQLMLFYWTMDWHGLLEEGFEAWRFLKIILLSLSYFCAFRIFAKEHENTPCVAREKKKK